MVCLNQPGRRQMGRIDGRPKPYPPGLAELAREAMALPGWNRSWRGVLWLCWNWEIVRNNQGMLRRKVPFPYLFRADGVYDEDASPVPGLAEALPDLRDAATGGVLLAHLGQGHACYSSDERTVELRWTARGQVSESLECGATLAEACARAAILQGGWRA